MLHAFPSQLKSLVGDHPLEHEGKMTPTSLYPKAASRIYKDILINECVGADLNKHKYILNQLPLLLATSSHSLQH